MKKDKRNILILIVVIIVVILMSYLLFFSGLTDKLKANVQGLDASINNNVNPSDLPKIDNLINSSGENIVNTDVAITINASSIYNIKNIEYSYDLKHWKNIKGDYNKKEVSAKLVFSNTMNEEVYIRVMNERGYKSYAIKTLVNIDKEIPKLIVGPNGNDTVIKASDNVGVTSVQYSSDKLNWEDIEVSGESIVLTRNFNKETYIRVVDEVGNISKIKKVD